MNLYQIGGIVFTVLVAVISYFIFTKAKSNKIAQLTPAPKIKNKKFKILTELSKAISVRQPYAELIMMGLKPKSTEVSRQTFVDESTFTPQTL